MVDKKIGSMKKTFSQDLLSQTYYILMKIRMVEERIASEYPKNEIRKENSSLFLSRYDPVYAQANSTPI